MADDKTVYHQKAEYPVELWKQPGETFAHRWEWWIHCSFCTYDLYTTDWSSSE